MMVSKRTLSLWETDVIYPKWSMQPIVVKFLGHDPFTNPPLGAPPSNKPPGNAILGSNSAESLGQKIRTHRLSLRKTRKDFASELGVSVKAVWEWETNRRRPCPTMRNKINTSFI